MTGNNPMSFFSDNVDAWGPLEWFDRLAKAVHARSRAVGEKDELSFEFYQNIASSSATRLVSDFEDRVRMALTTVRELEKANVAYVDANTELLSTLESLQRENEELRQRLDIGPCGEDAIDVAESAADHLRHRAEAAEAEVKQLREALQPFSFDRSKIKMERFDEDNQALVAIDGAGSDRLAFFVRDILRARTALATQAEGEPRWQPIETAPKDGTVIDLWHEEFERQPDCYWGKPQHSCGEYGKYCDSDWHSEPEGWVDSALNCSTVSQDDMTHWMPLPAAPAKQEGGE